MSFPGLEELGLAVRYKTERLRDDAITWAATAWSHPACWPLRTRWHRFRHSNDFHKWLERRHARRDE